MADLGTIIPAAGMGSVLTFAGNAALQWFNTREARRNQSTQTSAVVEQHRDQLTLDVVAMARTEATYLLGQLAASRAEAAIGRSVQGRLSHFEEALDHLSALLAASEAEERRAAERRASAFLKRMRRLAEAEGTMRNEEQIRLSGEVAAQSDQPPTA